MKLTTTLVDILLVPVALPFVLLFSIQKTYPHYVKYFQYKLSNERYIRFNDIPLLAQPKFNELHYNSYKDRILTVQDNNMCFAYKYVDKQTNNIVYVTENKDFVITDIEQYKLKCPLRET